MTRRPNYGWRLVSIRTTVGVPARLSLFQYTARQDDVLGIGRNRSDQPNSTTAHNTNKFPHFLVHERTPFRIKVAPIHTEIPQLEYHRSRCRHKSTCRSVRQTHQDKVAVICLISDGSGISPGKRLRRKRSFVMTNRPEQTVHRDSTVGYGTTDPTAGAVVAAVPKIGDGKQDGERTGRATDCTSRQCDLYVDYVFTAFAG